MTVPARLSLVLCAGDPFLNTLDPQKSVVCLQMAVETCLDLASRRLGYIPC